MTTAPKTSLLITLVIIGILAASFFLFTDTFVDSAPTGYIPEVQVQTKPIVSDALFYVSVTDTVVLEVDTITVEEAAGECSAIAYNPDYMWQQVICVYAGEEIYNDIFIAG